jgi:hypothetical protein
MRPTGLEPHVYRLKWWVRLWYMAWGVLFGGLAVTFIVLLAATDDWKRSLLDWHALLFCLFFPAMAYFFFALALRSRVTLEGSRISVRGPMREKSADIHEIVGYRIGVTTSATFWRIELRSGKRLSIMRSFRVDGAFHDFLSRLKQSGEQGMPSSVSSN